MRGCFKLPLLGVWLLLALQTYGFAKPAEAQIDSQAFASYEYDIGEEAGFFDVSIDVSTNGTEVDVSSEVDTSYSAFFDGIWAGNETEVDDSTRSQLIDVEDADYGESVASLDLGPYSIRRGDTITGTATAYACYDVDDGEGDEEEECDEVGPVSAAVQTGSPDVLSISPSTITVGSSGSLTVNGQNLLDQFNDQPTPFLQGNSTINLSLGNISDTQATVNYSSSTSGTTGSFQFGLSGPLGYGETVNLTVGDPSPVITGVNPSTWPAGSTNLQVTITGQNFGSHPSLSLSAIGLNSSYSYSGSDTQIVANVTVAANAPNNPVTISVQSTGYGGNGFAPGSPGSGSSTSSAQIAAVTPAPVINLLNGTTTSPYAGQLISLSVTSPYAGLNISSQTWSFGAPSDVVGGYAASAANGSVVPVANTTSASLSFFYITPGASETASVNVNYDNGTSASASVSFSVQGPTGNVLPNAFVQIDDSASHLVAPQGNPATLQMTNAPGMPNVGIWFNDLASLPSNAGNFIWVQLLHSVQFSQIEPVNGGYTPPTSIGEGLDGVYPYPGNSITSDRPSRPLYAGEGEGADSFDATMYVLWDPAIPPAGQQSCVPAHTDTTVQPYNPVPTTCSSIPIPLGSVRWRWSACAINTVPSSSGGPSWLEHCGPGKAYPAAVSGYPQWNSCNTSANADCH